jgi:hypoxanthine phosphoribosyltransferase
LRVVLTAKEIELGVERLAEHIRNEYGARPLTILAVMTGSVVLLADLIRRLDMPLRVGVLQASSYRGATTTRGELMINMEMTPDVKDRDVLLVDDIFDTGHTLAKIVEKMKAMQPRSVRSVVLLRKHGRQEVEYQPDFSPRSRFRMSLWSAMGSTTRMSIATCPISRCWSRAICSKAKRCFRAGAAGRWHAGCYW